MSSPRGISGVIVRGIDPQNAAIVSQLLQYIQQGTLGSLSAAGSDAAARPGGAQAQTPASPATSASGAVRHRTAPIAIG